MRTRPFFSLEQEAATSIPAPLYRDLAAGESLTLLREPGHWRATSQPSGATAIGQCPACTFRELARIPRACYSCLPVTPASPDNVHYLPSDEMKVGAAVIQWLLDHEPGGRWTLLATAKGWRVELDIPGQPLRFHQLDYQHGRMSATHLILGLSEEISLIYGTDLESFFDAIGEGWTVEELQTLPPSYFLTATPRPEETN